MNNLISICIPTYQRSQLLKETIKSCLIQNYRPFEKIIGDDSKDNITENLIREMQSGIDVKLRYQRNVPSLGQAGNVNKLFDMAEGERLVLLHDDDLLLPDALVKLANCWQMFPDLTAAYGKQYIISTDGKISEQQSEELNRFFYRTSKQAGLQARPLESSLIQQFPNDGYMILSSVAREVRYRLEEEIGDSCDFDFGLRLGAVAHQFYFLNEYTMKYRLTDTSISNRSGTNVIAKKYYLMKSLKLPADLENVRNKILHQDAPTLVSYYIKTGEKAKALQIYFSQDYPSIKYFSLRGILQLLVLLMPIPTSFFIASYLRMRVFWRLSIKRA